MVLVHQVQEPVEELLALLFGYIVNMAQVATDGEDALPPCYRIRPDNRVNGPEN